MKTLIAYFSASGTTRNVANDLANLINADVFEIEPKETYLDTDLNWLNRKSRSSIEMKDETSRPEIKNKIENLNEYDKILIGFPVWWYTAPRIINTFLEENDLTNKQIYIFVTSGGSSFAKSLKDLSNTYSNLNFVRGIRIKKVKEDEIKEWLK